MIEFPSNSLLPQIKALWKDAFFDSDAAIDFYFSNRHKNENMLVFTENGKVLSMLSMLPLSLYAQGNTFPARYIYAVATLTAFRGRGLSSALLDYAHNYMINQKIFASVLVPASTSLFNFYKKRGYESCFEVDTLTIKKEELPPCPTKCTLTPCDIDIMFSIRRQAFGKNRLFAEWDRAALSYISKTAWQGGAMYFSHRGGEGCCVYECREKEVFVKDLALLSLDVYTAIAILHKKLCKDLYHIRLPAQSGGKNASRRKFGMINWLNEKNVPSLMPPYFGLAMD
ncbi:MAG: GNAT family N-acetyltransferase [Clostridia bacterium]|nr:GNAT family N-acetyltransferase [Clostridia bacterium]